MDNYPDQKEATEFTGDTIINININNNKVVALISDTRQKQTDHNVRLKKVQMYIYWMCLASIRVCIYKNISNPLPWPGSVVY